MMYSSCNDKYLIMGEQTTYINHSSHGYSGWSHTIVVQLYSISKALGSKSNTGKKVAAIKKRHHLMCSSPEMISKSFYSFLHARESNVNIGDATQVKLKVGCWLTLTLMPYSLAKSLPLACSHWSISKSMVKNFKFFSLLTHRERRRAIVADSTMTPCTGVKHMHIPLLIFTWSKLQLCTIYYRR